MRSLLSSLKHTHKLPQRPLPALSYPHHFRTLTQCAELLLEEALPRIEVAAGIIFLYNDATATWEVAAARGFLKDEIFLWKGEAHAEDSLFARAPVFIDSRERVSDTLMLALSRYAAHVVLPLLYGERSIGVLGISFHSPQRFNKANRHYLIELAQQFVLHLEQTRLAIGLRAESEAIRFQLTQETLGIVTEGKFILCRTLEELPQLFPFQFPIIQLDTSSALRDVRLGIREIVPGTGLPSDKTMDLLIAVGEAAMNAITHGGGGTVEISGDTEHGSVRVRVQDHGPGISFDILPRAVLQQGFTTRGSLGHGFSMLLSAADRVWLQTGSEGTTLIIEQNRRATDLRDAMESWARTAELWNTKVEGPERNHDLSEMMVLSSPDILYIFDLIEQRSIYTNHASAMVQECTPGGIQALEETTHTSLLHPDDAASLRSFLVRRNATLQGEFAEIEYRVRHGESSWRWLQARETICTRDQSGCPTQIFGVVQDITERKLRETSREQIIEMLRANEQRLNEAQTIAQTGSWEFDLASDRFLWSPETFRLLHFDPTKGEPDYFTVLNRYHPEDQQGHEAAVQKALNEGTSCDFEARMVFPEGAVRWMRVRGKALKGSNGKVTGLTGTIQDITDMKSS